MTLIAGIVCDDGVILAADSASTDPEAGSKQPMEKIRRVDTLKLIYGASGDVGLFEKIHEALAGLTLKATIKKTSQELRARILPEIKDAIDTHVPYPAVGYSMPPVAVLLFAGVIGKQPFLIEIERDGRDTFYNAELGNFAAIGSGKPWAQAIFRPFLYTPRRFELGKIFAYRVMNDAIDLAAGFVAKPIHIWIVPVQGDIALVDESEMKKLADTREVWRSLEAEAVGRLLEPKAKPTTPAEIPTPEGAVPQAVEAQPPEPGVV